MTNEEIDDKIEEWHMNESITVPLHEYLGWTWEQYSKWITKPHYFSETKEN